MQSDESVRPKWIKLAKVDEHTFLPNIREIISDCLYCTINGQKNIRIFHLVANQMLISTNNTFKCASIPNMNPNMLDCGFISIKVYLVG